MASGESVFRLRGMKTFGILVLSFGALLVSGLLYEVIKSQGDGSAIGNLRVLLADEGGVEILATDARVFGSHAFGGSNFSRWTGLNKQAKGLVREINRRRKKFKSGSAPTDGQAAGTQPDWRHIGITVTIGVPAVVAMVVDRLGI